MGSPGVLMQFQENVSFRNSRKWNGMNDAQWNVAAVARRGGWGHK